MHYASRIASIARSKRTCCVDCSILVLLATQLTALYPYFIALTLTKLSTTKAAS